jgi:hypothetical protein
MSCIVCCPSGAGRGRFTPAWGTSSFDETVVFVFEVSFELASGADCVFGYSTASDEAAGDVDRVVKKRTVMKIAATTRARRKLSIVPDCSSATARVYQQPYVEIFEGFDVCARTEG